MLNRNLMINPNPELIQGYFKNHELVFVSKTTRFAIEKVLRKNRAREMSLVQYQGLPETFTEWLPTLDVESAEDKAKFTPLLKYANLKDIVSNDI